MLAMVGHLAVPAMVGDATTPATFAPEIVRGVLRDELEFAGVSVSDALNMGALGPRDDAPSHAVRAARAGLDLLLLLHPPALERAATTAVAEAIAGGSIDQAEAKQASARIDALRTWLASAPERPALDAVGCPDHRALAREVAERSVTLVRDDGAVLPLRPDDDVLVLAPRPVDLTPADTTSYLEFGLAQALVDRGVRAEAIEVPLEPSAEDIASLRTVATGRVVVVGTVDASVHAGQAALVHAISAVAPRTLAVALRTPFDVVAYPRVPAYACSYGIQGPTVEALAGALTGRLPFRGRLPVRLPARSAA
jgi:beta-N-acetylhexosaminidase